MEKAMRDGIEVVLRERQKIKTLQEGIKDAVQALGEKFDIKPAQLNKIIGLIEKEREKGGVLAAEREMLDVAEDAVL